MLFISSIQFSFHSTLKNEECQIIGKEKLNVQPYHLIESFILQICNEYLDDLNEKMHVIMRYEVKTLAFARTSVRFFQVLIYPK